MTQKRLFFKLPRSSFPTPSQTPEPHLQRHPIFRNISFILKYHPIRPTITKHHLILKQIRNSTLTKISKIFKHPCPHPPHPCPLHMPLLHAMHAACIACRECYSISIFPSDFRGIQPSTPKVHSTHVPAHPHKKSQPRMNTPQYKNHQRYRYILGK